MDFVLDEDVEKHLLCSTTRFDPDPEIKSILVTGGNGFIGSWIVDLFTSVYPVDYHVVSFDKLEYGASHNNVSMLMSLPNFTCVEGDIMNPDDVKACLEEHNIDAIIHLAAQTNVDASIKNPLLFATTNIEGTQVILECAKSSGVKKFIQMSSFEAYGATKPGTNGHREDEVLSPMNPYGAGKAAAEMLVIAAGHSSSLEVMIVRANNVYGPRQFPDKIIPKFTMLLQRGLKLTLHGDGHSCKGYLYAADAANAFNAILHRGKNGEIFNLGARTEISNRKLSAWLVDMVDIPRSSGSSSSSRDSSSDKPLDAWIKTVPGRPYVERSSRLDCGRLEALGWTQNVGLDAGLRMTIDWYATHGEDWWGDVSRIFEGHV